MTLTLPNLGEMEDTRKPELSQWYSPDWLADRIWAWWFHAHGILLNRKLRVLEPAAGRGALIRPALRGGECERIHAIDIDPRNCAVLSTLRNAAGIVHVEHRNFLEPTRGVTSPYDVALMNPPYENGQDADFILHALKWAPTVVGVFRSAIVHGGDRYERLWKRVDIKRGKWLRARPSFGSGKSGDSAKSDFVVLELEQRWALREADEDMMVQMGWW